MFKHILAILLAIILLILFVSCKRDAQKIWQDARFSYDGVSAGSIGSGIIWIRTYEKYRTFKCENPVGEVFYSQIAYLGEFQYYAMIKATAELFEGDPYTEIITYDYVAYLLNDCNENGDGRTLNDPNCMIELHIFFTDQDELCQEEASFLGIQPIDIACVDRNTGMRKLLDGYYGGFVDVDGVRYIYTHSKLQGIKWAHAGHEFMLYVPDQYPQDRTHTFAGRMLNPDLAPSAVVAFKKAYDACGEVL